MSEVCFPNRVVGLVNLARARPRVVAVGPQVGQAAERVSPHGVVGRVDDAAAVVIAQYDRRPFHGVGDEVTTNRCNRRADDDSAGVDVVYVGADK